MANAAAYVYVYVADAIVNQIRAGSSNGCPAMTRMERYLEAWRRGAVRQLPGYTAGQSAMCTLQKKIPRTNYATAFTRRNRLRRIPLTQACSLPHGLTGLVSYILAYAPAIIAPNWLSKSSACHAHAPVCGSSSHPEARGHDQVYANGLSKLPFCIRDAVLPLDAEATH